MIGSFMRENNYIRQGLLRIGDIEAPPRPLTPKQRRRIKHKQGHQEQVALRVYEKAKRHSRKAKAPQPKTKDMLTKSIENVAEESAKPKCPTCHAVLDERCKTRDGRPTRRHKGRPE